jgi:flavin reductase (DIM6/NTAB) family NADH-FMN oxidoreductase RutF
MSASKVVQPTELRLFAGHFPTGVAVVTTQDRSGKNHGITINAVTSLSLDPALLLICLDHRSKTLSALLESGCFCLHFLGAHQASLSQTFAAKHDDKFGAVGFQIGTAGCPVLDGVVAASECRVTAVHPGGDHTIIVAAVERVHVTGGEPLLFHRGAYANLEPAKLAA